MNISVFHARILRFVAAFGLIYAASAIAPLSARAQSQVASANSAVSQAQIEACWTPQRLKNAQPLELHPIVGPNGFPISDRP